MARRSPDVVTDVTGLAAFLLIGAAAAVSGVLFRRAYRILRGLDAVR